jgi:hypothetical protein
MFFRACIASALVLSLWGCDRDPFQDAMLVDFLGADCPARPPRPDDCYVYPPCPYFDVVLSLGRAEQGGLTLIARAGHAMFGESPQTAEFDVSSPRDAARLLVSAISALDLAPPVGGACVIIRVDQSLPFDHVTEFNDSLEAVGARHVGLFLELAADPYRSINMRITGIDGPQIDQALRAYAAERAMQYSTYGRIYATDESFLISGNGVSISASSLEAGAWFRLSAEMTLAADGAVPTEAMMDQEVVRLVEHLTKAGARVETNIEYSSAYPAH